MIALDVRSGPFMAVWRSNPCGVLYEIAKRAPGQPVNLRVGDETIFVLQDTPGAAHVLRSHPERYNKHFGSFEYFFGASRLTSDGDRWKALQAISQPFIAATPPQQVIASASRFFELAAARLLGEASPDGSVPIEPALNQAAASVISEVTLGFNTQQISETLLDDFRVLLRASSTMTWNLPGAEQTDDMMLREAALGAKSRLRAGVSAMLAQRQRNSGSAPDLLSTLLDARDVSVDVLGEICTLLFAGFDTTAATLSWALFLLATDPELQETLRAQVLAELGDSDPTEEALASIPQLVSFQNEVLRIFPAVPILGRIANSVDQIGDIDIGVGQKVLVSTIGLHHDRRHFVEPAKVKLDRFPGGRMRSEDHGHFLPFGTGRRVCGGSRIAGVELTTALAVLLRRIEVGLVDVGPLLFDWDASLRRKGGHRLLIRAL